MSGDRDDVLRDELIRAASSADRAAFVELCRGRRDAIVRAFPTWLTVPLDVRKSRDAMQRYAEALITVARVFADDLGEPSLLSAMQLPAASNPLHRWKEKLARARSLMEDLAYDEAIELLTDQLIDTRGLQGTAVDAFLPVTFGTLGECYFHSGQAEKAVAPVRNALELCEKSADREGVRAYLGNLYEIHRYRGDATHAASFAERLAPVLDELGRPNDATWYRKQAELSRRGEPKNRIVVEVGDRRHELDDAVRLAISERAMRFVFVRNRISLHPAVVLCGRGEKRASEGSEAALDEALGLFDEASAADRFDPQPRYQAGFTLLLLRRAAEAADAFAAADELAPGWFHSRADRWIAEQIETGRVSHETFLAIHALEESPRPAAERVRQAERALQEASDVAWLHLLHGKALMEDGKVVEAEAAFRRGLTCGDEPDVRTRLLLNVGLVTHDPEQARRHLAEAASLRGNLVAAAMAAVALPHAGRAKT